jgi:hypothetical protein
MYIHGTFFYQESKNSMENAIDENVTFGRAQKIDSVKAFGRIL